MFALVSTSPPSVLSVFTDVPASIDAGGLHVDHPPSDWSSDDAAYKLLPVTVFIPPLGQVNVGSASYAFDGISVVETYQTQGAPLVISAREFRQLFTQTEVASITTAAQSSVRLRIFMDDEAASGTVNMGDPEVVEGINALVGAGLLTQARADQIKGASSG